MKKVILAVTAGAVLVGGAVLPAGAIAKKDTKTQVLSNGAVYVEAKGDKEATVKGPGKVILKRQNSQGKWIFKKAEDVNFQSPPGGAGGLAYFDTMKTGTAGKCKIVGKYLGNATYAPSKSDPYPIHCKDGSPRG